jgi:dienelactone hydrolase
MMAKVCWTADPRGGGDVHEREFGVERGGSAIPGVAWYPARAGGKRALVLIGHGGSGHKRSAKMVRLGQLFAAQHGCWAVAIDGPVHGGRGPVTDPTHPAYRQMWQRPNVVQNMIDDWRTVLDALCELEEIDSGRVGYWGLSMGTMFGLPYVASDARIRAAVLGKAGMSGPSVERSGIDKHFRIHAPQVRIPLLFAMQWDDERFDRDGQFALFDVLGARDKRLHAYPGPHSDDGPESFAVGADFVMRYLAA